MADFLASFKSAIEERKNKLIAQAAETHDKETNIDRPEYAAIRKKIVDMCSGHHAAILAAVTDGDAEYMLYTGGDLKRANQLSRDAFDKLVERLTADIGALYSLDDSVRCEVYFCDNYDESHPDYYCLRGASVDVLIDWSDSFLRGL